MSVGDAIYALMVLRMVETTNETNTLVKGLVGEMATVQEVLSQMSSDVDAISEDVPRVLTELQRLLDEIATGNVTLPAEMQTRVDEMRGKLSSLNQAMDAAVPPQVTEPPAEPVNPVS